MVDSRIEILQNEQKEIFDRFYRALNAFSMYNEGVKIGLYISKIMMSKYNGKIGFKNIEVKIG